ncbi:papilin isoform X2 [Denticeps clupeoides]|uniref:papilin isoform X2 n=1 Tax=Denticeps clupeoides TaxID=299321 RepID=UPI0010A4BDFA|nr:papilin isoform X2 [Denticeps clupeoides]
MMKMLLVLTALQLLLTPVLLQRSGDHWEAWGPYGECSRTCGTGVAVRTRRCITQRTDGGLNCVGPAQSYHICSTQQCPEGSKDFREEQCSQFDGNDFQGRLYKWLPYYGAENPCELNCIPRGENFFYRHRSAVVDGTPCHPGRKDICVDGVCKRLGCDNKLDSSVQEDPCLQCGGNSQSCYVVKGTFSEQGLPTGYNQMFIIPVGASSISIRETVATRNYLAVKNLRGEYYLNGHWVIEFSRATPVAGTVLYYQRGAEGEAVPEAITGRGPTTEPLVLELISQEPNQGVEFEYYLPNGRSREGYYWSYGSWSACSKECSAGYQSRLVFCAIDNEAYPDYLCASLPRPADNRTCNEPECPETRRMAFVYKPQRWRPKERPQVYIYVYSWKVGEWNQCSVTCGGGSQVRTVECVSHDASGPRVVEDGQCESYAQRPLSLQNCNMQQCSQYSTSAWSQCSVTCGDGQQTREVMCVGAGGVRVGDHACRTLLKPPHIQPCQMSPCQRRVRWHVGDWGMCSKSCESGLRERQVICSDAQRTLYGVEHCSTHQKPATVESCNTQPCYRPQEVPSMPDPRGHENTQHGFHPYVPEEQPTGIVQHCTQTHFGCCPDGRTPARGRQGLGCPQEPVRCSHSSYGCCRDGVTMAQGPNKEGCVEYVPPAPTVSTPTHVESDCQSSTYGCCFDHVTPAGGPYGEGCPTPPRNTQRSATCYLPHTAGPCSDWTPRYYYDNARDHCEHYWYGGCHGNSNNFMSREDCLRFCQITTTSSRGSRIIPAVTGNRTQTWDMRRIFTVPRGGGNATSHVRLGASAANNAHRARIHLRSRRPAPAYAQHSLPSASWTDVGVSIDKSDPSTVEGRVGQTVVMPCRVTPPPSSTVVVEWRRDGTPLSPSRHLQQPDGSLLVGPLTMQDSGWLLCVATRERERDHRYIYLSVSEQPQIAVDRPDTSQSRDSYRFSIDRSGSSLVEARAGQTARLHCRITPASAIPSVTLQWTKAGQTLNTIRHSLRSDGTLVVGQLTSDDSGVYTCSASTNQQLEQLQVQLRVLGDVRITTAPNNVQVPQGSTAQLPCVVSGDNVNVGWSRNGVPVRPDGRRIHVSADGSLILNSVQLADEGTYTCNAYAGTYSVSATAEVRVTRSSQPGAGTDFGVPTGCVDQPELANCKLIVYARLCSSQYYSSFCCESCTRYAQGLDTFGLIG